MQIIYNRHCRRLLRVPPPPPPSQKLLVHRSLILLLLGILVSNTQSVQALKTTIQSTVSPPQQRSAGIMTAKGNEKQQNDESTVLGELKETIRKQQEEITKLKVQLKQAPPSKKVVASVGHGGGHHGSGDAGTDIEFYLSQPFYEIAMKRVGWLGLFLLSLSLTALIMNTFEKTLEGQIELAYFVPMLAGHGGNTGGQTVGTVLSAISSGLVNIEDAPRVIGKEAMSGVMSGILLAIVVGPTAHYIMGISQHVTTVLFFTMPLVSTIAATLGSAIPFICLVLGLDPSVIAAPAMTSFVDVSGLMSYFLIANFIFKLFGLEL